MRSYLRDAARAKETSGDAAGIGMIREGAQYYTSLIQNAINGHPRRDTPLILYALETCARVLRDGLGPGARSAGDEIVKLLHEMLDERIATVDASELAAAAERRDSRDGA